MQHFFQVDMEPFIEKNIGIRSQGSTIGEKTITPRWMLSHAENFLNVYVKRTVQDNVGVKSINLDAKSYVDALEIATIELVFKGFWRRKLEEVGIFFKKSTNNVI